MDLKPSPLTAKLEDMVPPGGDEAIGDRAAWLGRTRTRAHSGGGDCNAVEAAPAGQEQTEACIPMTLSHSLSIRFPLNVLRELRELSPQLTIDLNPDQSWRRNCLARSYRLLLHALGTLTTTCFMHPGARSAPEKNRVLVTRILVKTMCLLCIPAREARRGIFH